jgi:phosphoribosyl 1,2-cyclic phosphodiesterase
VSLSFVLVDDDHDILDILKFQMELEGHSVRAFSSGVEALESILSDPPDCVVTDIMMPELDGVELTRKLRESPKLDGLKILVLSGKIYQTDKDRALDAGADAFLAKSRHSPSETLEAILDLICQRFVLKFWGCRGTIPVPGPKTVKYGGNTSCVSLTFPDEHIFVFDAGTGIKPLATSLMKTGKKKLTGTVFFSHPHWDHINFIPFFVPLFVPGNQFRLVGSPVQEMGIEQLVGNQMGGVHFPITAREFGAQVLYQDIGEGRYEFGPAVVETMLLCHPGNCLGYSVYYADKKICYITDNELFPEESDMFSPSYIKRLTEFVKDADILIMDSTYFDEEYRQKMGWGHSSLSSVCNLAHQANVKEFFLFHHDPEQDDSALERKLAICQNKMRELQSSVKVRLAEAELELVVSN